MSTVPLPDLIFTPENSDHPICSVQSSKSCENSGARPRRREASPRRRWLPPVNPHPMRAVIRPSQ